MGQENAHSYAEKIFSPPRSHLIFVTGTIDGACVKFSRLNAKKIEVKIRKGIESGLAILEKEAASPD